MLNIALLSFWNHYHAEGFVRGLSGRQDVKISCLWDEDPARGKLWSQKLDIPFVPKLEDVLRHRGTDGVILNAAPWEQAPLAAAAAREGIHILADKIPAMGTQQESLLKDSMAHSSSVFATAFPLIRRPYFQTARREIALGRLGNVSMIRMREAHDGLSGGSLPAHFHQGAKAGVFCDLGFHILYAAPYLLGKNPTGISAHLGSFCQGETEDNGVCVLVFPGGAFAQGEASYASKYSPFSLEIYGDKGVLLCGGPDGTILENISGSRETLSPSPALPLPEEDWLDAIIHKRPPMFGLDDGLDVARRLDALYLSAREHRLVSL